MSCVILVVVVGLHLFVVGVAVAVANLGDGARREVTRRRGWFRSVALVRPVGGCGRPGRCVDLEVGQLSLVERRVGAREVELKMTWSIISSVSPRASA